MKDSIRSTPYILIDQCRPTQGNLSASSELLFSFSSLAAQTNVNVLNIITIDIGIAIILNTRIIDTAPIFIVFKVMRAKMTIVSTSGTLNSFELFPNVVIFPALPILDIPMLACTDPIPSLGIASETPITAFGAFYSGAATTIGFSSSSTMKPMVLQNFRDKLMRLELDIR